MSGASPLKIYKVVKDAGVISFSTYDPIQFLLKTTYEFENSKAIITEKSLMAESRFEIDYSNIAHFDFCEIRNETVSNFGFWTILLTSFIFPLLLSTHSTTPSNDIVFAIGRIVSAIGIASYLLAYKSSLTCFLRNQQGNFLCKIKINPGNYKLVLQALSLVTKKIKGIKQTSPYEPLPKTKPKYEIIDYDLPSGIKSTTKFYGNKIISVQNAVSYRSVRHINYSDLSGKILYVKRANKDWFGASLTSSALGVSLFIIAFFIFPVPSNRLVLESLLGFAVLLFSPALLSFTKQELIGLYNKQGNLVYVMEANKSNKEKIKAILQFIQSKISSRKSRSKKAK